MTDTTVGKLEYINGSLGLAGLICKLADGYYLAIAETMRVTVPFDVQDHYMTFPSRDDAIAALLLEHRQNVEKRQQELRYAHEIMRGSV